MMKIPNRCKQSIRILLVVVCARASEAFLPVPIKNPYLVRVSSFSLNNNNNNDYNDNIDNDNDEASRLRAKAQELRQEIQKLEDALGTNRRQRPTLNSAVADIPQETSMSMSLRNKRILVAGANGRLGSMICRYLLRNHPELKEVVAAVHYVGEDSPTMRGYGRLSYEVGAEDGVGSIGPAWSAEDRTATFQYNGEIMKDYNLQKLRVVPVELLDPKECIKVTEGVDSIIYCATDFNGNSPRAVSSLNFAFLFRAVADPFKGRVEVEGLRNILGALKTSLRNKAWLERNGVESYYTGSKSDSNPPINVVLVSTSPNAFPDFETPSGTFHTIKREGEDLLKNEFPSLSYTILQMARYEDNFVEENLDVILAETMPSGVDDVTSKDDAKQSSLRRIHRRDAARAVANALTNEELVGKSMEVWTVQK